MARAQFMVLLLSSGLAVCLLPMCGRVSVGGGGAQGASGSRVTVV